MTHCSLISRIRTAILGGGDSDSLLAQLAKQDGSAAIKPLLLMMEYNEEQFQEMYIRSPIPLRAILKRSTSAI